MGLHKAVMERKWSRLVKWVLNYLMGIYGPCQAPGHARLAQYSPCVGWVGLDLASKRAGLRWSGSFYIPTEPIFNTTDNNQSLVVYMEKEIPSHQSIIGLTIDSHIYRPHY